MHYDTNDLDFGFAPGLLAFSRMYALCSIDVVYAVFSGRIWSIKAKILYLSQLDGRVKHTAHSECDLTVMIGAFSSLYQHPRLG